MNPNDTVSKMGSSTQASTSLVNTSPTALGLATLVTSLAVLLVYLAYTPHVDPRAPEFTTDTTPLIGTFWRDSVARSKTGQFSFWLGKNHVVGVSGQAARKVFLQHQDLDRIKAAPMHGVGPEIVPPIHGVFQPNFSKGHSYFQRRVLDLMKSEHLGARLHVVTRDARTAFRALADAERRKSMMEETTKEAEEEEQDDGNGGQGKKKHEDKRGMADGAAGAMVTNPIDACYRLVLKQGVRMMCCDELAETPELFERYVAATVALQHLSSGHTFAVPWLPSLAHAKRRYYRSCLQRLYAPLVQRRTEESAGRTASGPVSGPAAGSGSGPGSGPRTPDDALQILINSGDSADYIVTFLISILFISIANAGKLAGILLNLICQHPSWQDRVHGEIMAAIPRCPPARTTTGNNPTLVDRLDAMPLDVWETAFPFVDQLLREAIRMHVSFPMTRLNVSARAIPIPGTDQVIPAGSLVAYNTNDAHLNEELYPNPMRFDPDR
ncbi:hypothetical protein E4U43_005552, partial [Claviceps pusilla]